MSLKGPMRLSKPIFGHWGGEVATPPVLAPLRGSQTRLRACSQASRVEVVGEKGPRARFVGPRERGLGRSPKVLSGRLSIFA